MTETRLNAPWRWFTLKRSDGYAIDVQAHDYSVDGTPAGWLVEFYEFVACFTDDAEDALVAQTQRSYIVPSWVTFEVIEVEISATGARAH